jgi:hypothetical protein
MFSELQSDCEVEWRNGMFECEEKFVDWPKKLLDFRLQVNQNCIKFFGGQMLQSFGHAAWQVDKVKETWNLILDQVRLI